MALKNLSKDIESAIENAIEGLGYSIDIEKIPADRLGATMESKVVSFLSTKKLISSWENSLNAPNNDKLRYYIEKLINEGDNNIDTLRASFIKKTDFSEVKEDKIGLTIESKNTIFEAINKINAATTELRMQLDSDKFSLKEKEFARGFPEKFANQEFLPLKNYYKQWYNESEDAIMICPKGTKGEIIELDGLKIQLPKVPPRKEILFSNEKPENQFWKRQPLPKGLTPESEAEFYDYIIEEFRRRREGVWFMNNTEPVYLTGAHYMSLQWIKMLDNGDYMDFRHAQKNMFYFTRACVIDPRCLGEIFCKSRRTGFTYQIICEMINDATSTNNAKFGMTSKTGEDAQEAFLKLSYGFRNLPYFFRPIVKGREDSKSEIEFAKPTDASKKAKQSRQSDTDGYLNTTINWDTTKNGAYDGQKMFRYLGDESSKWEKPHNYEVHWGRISPTFNNGGRIVGKALLGSTINPMNKGGREFVNLYNGSNVRKRNALGMTATGLYSYFLPAHKNMEEYTDKYGQCHEILNKGEYFYNAQGIKKSIGSIQHLEIVRKSKRAESDISYNEELRANPMTLEEAFRDELINATFNIEKINEQLNYNIANYHLLQLVRGDFEWKDGIPDSSVVWVPKSNGKFLVSWLPPRELQNKWTMKMNHGGYSKHPDNDDLGAFGCDTYDISSTTESVKSSTNNINHFEEIEDKRGSKGALHGLTTFTLGNAPSNHFFLEYIARPRTAEIFYEDVLKAIVFYGMPILVENNKPRLLYHLKNRGYRGYSITRFDKVANKLSSTEKELGGIPNSSEDVKNMHSSAIENYIDTFVGINNETQEIGCMPFNRTLDDWLHFDINNRTKYDASISSGLAIMAVKRASYIKKNEHKPIVLNLKKYNQPTSNLTNQAQW